MLRSSEVQEICYQPCQQTDFVKRGVESLMLVVNRRPCGQLRFEKLNVAVYGRKRILELVSKPGCHLAEARKVLLQFHPLSQFQDFCNICEQAKSAFRLHRSI